jgi:tetratricopeptide (TPR) repeat protein
MRQLQLILITIFISNFQYLASQDIPAFPRAETFNQKQQEEKDIEKLAAEYFRNRDYEKAVTLYKKLYEEKGAHLYYTYYILCLTELQDYKEALKLVSRQQKAEPNRLRYQVDEGFIYSVSGDQARAKRIFDRALETVPTVSAQIRELANAFNYRGQTDYAIRTYLKGRENISDQQFHLELANIYSRMDRHQDMVNEYLDLIDIDLSRMDHVRGRLQSALEDDPEGTKNDLLRRELLRRIQRSPDKTHYAEMLIWHSVQQRDFDMALIQAKSLDSRLQEQGSRIYDLAALCLSNSAYDPAIDAYNYLTAKGTGTPFYLDARIGLLNAKYLKVINRFDYTKEDLLDLENEYHKALDEFGKNSSTVPIMRYLAHLQAFYLDNIDYSIELLDTAIEMPAVTPVMKAECKVELADILLFAGNVWDATLLYSQVEYDFKHDPIGFEAKFKNAKLSFYIGEFGWAKAQLDVLKAATSKLIANDAMELSLLIADNIDLDSTYTALGHYSRADLLIYRNRYDQAIATLDSIQMLSLWHSLNDDVLFKKAEIKLRQGKHAEADSLLARVVSMYPNEILADDALWMRANMQETIFQDILKAKELYEKILFDYPGSLFTVEARKRFRTLRGDMTN